MSIQPSLDLSVESRTNWLQGIKVTICGGGGIASIELPKVARELRRHGAEVFFVVTENCLRFIGKESLEWASSRSITINPTGFAEHICMSDCVLVFPATVDLIGKIAAGLATDGPTTLIQSAFGQKKPILICPTMHESLADSPFFQENLAKLLCQPNVQLVSPRVEEGKHKAPSPEVFALEVAHHYSAAQKSGNKLRACVTLGGTRVSLDPVRCLTNLSTGALGRNLVQELYSRGVSVTAVEGQSTEKLPQLRHLNVIKVPEYADMLGSLEKLNASHLDGIFHVAAVSDYVPVSYSDEKIASSHTELEVKLMKSKKFIELPELKKIPFQMACKLTSSNDPRAAEIALNFLRTHKLNLLLWNSSDALRGKEHCGSIFEAKSAEVLEMKCFSKQEIASEIARRFTNEFWK